MRSASERLRRCVEDRTSQARWTMERGGRMQECSRYSFRPTPDKHRPPRSAFRFGCRERRWIRIRRACPFDNRLATQIYLRGRCNRTWQLHRPGWPRKSGIGILSARRAVALDRNEEFALRTQRRTLMPTAGADFVCQQCDHASRVRPIGSVLGSICAQEFERGEADLVGRTQRGQQLPTAAAPPSAHAGAVAIAVGHVAAADMPDQRQRPTDSRIRWTVLCAREFLRTLQIETAARRRRWQGWSSEHSNFGLPATALAR